jgi:hypothetical protein
MMVRTVILLVTVSTCGCSPQYTADRAWDTLSSTYGAELARCRATGNTREQCCADHGNISGCNSN